MVGFQLGMIVLSILLLMGAVGRVAHHLRNITWELQDIKRKMK